MLDYSLPVIYQIKVVLQGISPMIWRRLLFSSESTVEDLHYTIQLAMGWEDIHLHHFIIYGKQYGVSRPGGIEFSDFARDVKLATFRFRITECFLYEYDFSRCPTLGTWRYWWRHLLRIEAILAPKQNQIYPVCIGGKGVCPPENCGGPWGFMEARQEYSVLHIAERFSSMPEDEDWAEYKEELRQLYPWLLVYLNRFDHHKINQRLLQYAARDKK